MGGATRGAGILKALGDGVLVTPFKLIADYEGLEHFPQVPLPLSDDILIYDRIVPFRNKGKRVSLDREPLTDVDMVIDYPILSHLPDELDPERAEAWWTAPILIAGNHVHGTFADPPTERILACRGGNIRKIRQFQEETKATHPKARLVTNHPRQFYWPALELMLTADQVIGEAQVQHEWKAARGLADPEGAQRAAAEIRRLL